MFCTYKTIFVCTIVCTKKTSGLGDGNSGYFFLTTYGCLVPPIYYVQTCGLACFVQPLLYESSANSIFSSKSQRPPHLRLLGEG